MNDTIYRLKIKYNIDFFNYDTEDKTLENVTFILNDGKRYKIWKPLFYRENGMCKILKFKIGDDYVNVVDLTDEVFYSMIETHICNFFKINQNERCSALKGEFICRQ